MPTPNDWKIKTDPETKTPVMDGSKIVYIDPEGKELPLDPVAMYVKIVDLGKENQKHREAKAAVEEKFSIFTGIDDVVKWKEDADKAIATVANFNDKDWMKAEKVEQLKREMGDAYENKLKQAQTSFGEKETALNTVIEKKNAQIRTLLVSNKFANSTFFSGEKRKTNLLPDVAEAYFGKHFRVEENDKTGDIKVVAYHANGDQILSKINPGDLAEFDEAISIIIDSHPQRDHFLRSTSGGSGGHGGDGGGGEGADELTKLEKQYAEAMKNGDAKTAISLTNKIHELRRKLKAA
jgi:hypothetical protein